MTQQFIQN